MLNVIRSTIRRLLERPVRYDNSNDRMAISDDAAERGALREFGSFVGKLLLVDSVCGYVDNDCMDFYGDHLVRVLPTSDTDVARWTCHEYLDPAWNVEVISGPARDEGATSCWIYGTTFVVSKP